MLPVYLSNNNSVEQTLNVHKSRKNMVDKKEGFSQTNKRFIF